MKNNHLTVLELKEILNYNEDTGIFTWKINKSGIKTNIAGSRNSLGYVVITINKKRYGAHRLAWFYVHEYMPEGKIDHKDRIRHHNWILNLREASNQCNMRNRKIGKNNTSGIPGVHSSEKGWRSYIYVNRKCKSLGEYEDFDEAVCHRLAGEQCLNWEDCRGKSPAYKYVFTNIQHQEDLNEKLKNRRKDK